jgi:hypothetical protein
VTSEEDPHELFLPEEEDDKPVKPVWISITRIRPTYENAGRSYPAGELTDVDAIKALFGGGTYRLQARDERKRVVAKREVTIRGKALPMDGAGSPEEEVQVHSPQSGGGDLTAAVKQICALVEASMRRSDEMLVKVVDMQANNANALVKAMSEHYAAMARVTTSVAAAPSPSAADEFRAGMQLGQEMTTAVLEASKANNDTATDSTSGDIKAIMEGLKMFVDARNGKTNPVVAQVESSEPIKAGQ